MGSSIHFLLPSDIVHFYSTTRLSVCKSSVWDWENAFKDGGGTRWKESRFCLMKKSLDCDMGVLEYALIVLNHRDWEIGSFCSWMCTIV